MKAKILAFTFALFSAGGVMAQEEDDLYFFTGDRKKIEEGSQLQVASPDKPSQAAKFSTPTSNTNSVSVGNPYQRNPLAGSGNVYVTNNYYGAGYNNAGFSNGFYYSPYAWGGINRYRSTYAWGNNSSFYYGGGGSVFVGNVGGGFNNAWCPPIGGVNTVYASNGYYSSGYANTGFNSNVWCPPAVRAPQPVLNAYCPPSGGGSNTSGRTETARTTRSSWNRSGSDRVYAPRSTTRSTTANRPANIASRTSSANVSRSANTNSRTTTVGSGNTRTYTPSNTGSSRTYTPNTSTGTRSTGIRTSTPSSSGSRSTGVRSTGSSSGGSRSTGGSSGGGGRSTGRGGRGN